MSYVCCVYTGLHAGTDYYRVQGSLMMDGEQIVEVYGYTIDDEHAEYKTVTGAAVVACTAGASVYVEADDNTGNSVHADSSVPWTTFSGFII